MEEVQECAICFEEVAECLSLPCSCRVPYCLRCWDRALAQSFNNTAQARCPTCRSPVRVDFDSETGRLLFSPETRQPNAAGDIESHEDVERLAHQAIPRQKKLLVEHGKRRGHLQGIRLDPIQTLSRMPEADLRQRCEQLQAPLGASSESKEKLAESLMVAAGGSDNLVCYWASSEATASGHGPLCVCGGTLQRTSGRARAAMMAEHMVAGRLPRDDPRVRDLTDQLIERGEAVICDLCDKHINWRGHVWTCTNGGETILHAASYDVCEECFLASVAPLLDASVSARSL